MSQLAENPVTYAAPQPAADWEAANPILALFQFGQESDTGGIKIGDGVTAWNDLPFFTRAGIKVYRAELTQSGTDAPTAVVRENTMGGEIVWTRDLAGQYTGTLAGAFPVGQTALSPRGFSYMNSAALPADDDVLVGMERNDADSISVKTVLGADSSGVDGYLSSWPIKITVYPL